MLLLSSFYTMAATNRVAPRSCTSIIENKFVQEEDAECLFLPLSSSPEYYEYWERGKRSDGEGALLDLVIDTASGAISNTRNK
jgi:hypothetical protein